MRGTGAAVPAADPRAVRPRAAVPPLGPRRGVRLGGAGRRLLAGEGGDRALASAEGRWAPRSRRARRRGRVLTRRSLVPSGPAGPALPGPASPDPRCSRASRWRCLAWTREGCAEAEVPVSHVGQAGRHRDCDRSTGTRGWDLSAAADGLSCWRGWEDSGPSLNGRACGFCRPAPARKGSATEGTAPHPAPGWPSDRAAFGIVVSPDPEFFREMLKSASLPGSGWAVFTVPVYFVCVKRKSRCCYGHHLLGGAARRFSR